MVVAVRVLGLAAGADHVDLTLSRPTSGTGRVTGHDIVDEPAAVRRSMGLTGQAATVDELLTGRENVRLIGRLYGLPMKYLRESTDELRTVGAEQPQHRALRDREAHPVHGLGVAEVLDQVDRLNGGRHPTDPLRAGSRRDPTSGGSLVGGSVPLQHAMGPRRLVHAHAIAPRRDGSWTPRTKRRGSLSRLIARHRRNERLSRPSGAGGCRDVSIPRR